MIPLDQAIQFLMTSSINLMHCLLILLKEHRQLIHLFQREIDYGVWTPSPEDPDRYIIEDS